MRIFFSIFFLACVVSLVSLPACAQDSSLRGGIMSSEINSPDEEYAPTIAYGTNVDTLYFTSSRAIAGKPRRALNAELMFATRSAEDRDLLAPNEGWSAAKQVIIRDSSALMFTRGAMAIAPDSQRAFFAAEHNLVNDKSGKIIGESFDLQLWQMKKEGNGTWGAEEEIAALIDTSSWNSQPAVSQDGTTLFFVSNRNGGAGGMDLWYSRFDPNTGWSPPRNVPNINTPGDEVAPHCGSDGKFYFSTNWDYKNKSIGATGRDIYRCEFKLINGQLLPVEPVNIDSAIRRDARALGNSVADEYHINSTGNDEFAFIAKGRSAIYFSSDRAGGVGKRDLYALALPQPKVYLYVNVRERTVDKAGSVSVAPHDKPGFPVIVTDMATREKKYLRSGTKQILDPDKNYLVTIDTATWQDECYNSNIEGANEKIVHTRRPALHDTTYFRDFLITRRPVEIKPIVFYSTDTLPYFITGYWWPNTTKNFREFRSRAAAGFFNRTGFVDSTGHDYEAIATRIDGKFYDSIYAPLLAVLKQFTDHCGDTLYLRVTVNGYTDPRPLSTGKISSTARDYPDSTVTIGVDEHKFPVTIINGMNMWKREWPRDSTHPDGAQLILPDTGQQGNILLSKLRAYFTFKTFDRDMRALSEEYRTLSSRGRILPLIEGYGVDKEGYRLRHQSDDPQSRRIEIYLDVLRKEQLK